MNDDASEYGKQLDAIEPWAVEVTKLSSQVSDLLAALRYIRDSSDDPFARGAAQHAILKAEGKQK